VDGREDGTAEGNADGCVLGCPLGCMEANENGSLLASTDGCEDGTAEGIEDGCALGSRDTSLEQIASPHIPEQQSSSSTHASPSSRQ
jgi:hypothetical protein